MNFPTRLYHPEHGYIHVYREKELKEWEAKGFKEAPEDVVTPAEITSVIWDEKKRRSKKAKA